METSHGGQRRGAGRPKGSGKYGEKTLAIRIPQSRVDEVMDFISSGEDQLGIPLYGGLVAAGLPSLADEFVEERVNLHDKLVRRPLDTFLVRVTGDSMIDASIFEGDLLVVDRAKRPSHGNIVVAAVDSLFTVKRLHQTSQRTALIPENPRYQPIEWQEGSEWVIQGVVTSVIREV